MQIKLAIALGNPGKTYEKTYHNAGFLFADYAEKQAPTHPQLAALVFRKTAGYMNESGSSVKKIAKELRIAPEHILLLHDDSDLPLGTYRFAFGRGSAGHKGVEDVMRVLGTKDFWRLRIGIRPPTAALPEESRPVGKAKDFVLKKISAKNLSLLKGAFEKAATELSESLISSSG